MAIEVERKYLVTGDSWRMDVVRTSRIQQGYLSTERDRVVRVRLVDGTAGALTVKGRRVGASKPEFEYAIPAADAEAMLDTLCVRPLVDKWRHFMRCSPGEWVVDEFLGENAGLVLAEVEFDPSIESELSNPSWVAADVTEDNRYANSSLVAQPFTTR